MQNQKLNTFMQYILPQHGLSRFAGWMAESRNPWLKNKLINWFIKNYHPDLSEALLPSLDDYPSFNAFFTRQLKPSARPIVQGQHEVASPADGCISQIGAIHQNTLLQAKGFHFDTASLLGGLQDQAPLFSEGSFATIYLAPRDYHRVHMPLSGTLRATSYIPGKLFSVNENTTRSVPNLFSRNERLVCLFDTAAGPMVVIMVGAMLVGNINTVWPQAINHTQVITTRSFTNPVHLERGAELGYFKMGSTVIVLFAKDKIEWATNAKESTAINMGQLLATYR